MSFTELMKLSTVLTGNDGKFSWSLSLQHSWQFCSVAKNKYERLLGMLFWEHIWPTGYVKLPSNYDHPTCAAEGCFFLHCGDINFTIPFAITNMCSLTWNFFCLLVLLASFFFMFDKVVGISLEWIQAHVYTLVSQFFIFFLNIFYWMLPWYL